MKKLPKFAIKSDDPQAGIERVSFVSEPAIKLKGIAFKQDIQHQMFKDDLKYRIVAPALIPDADIYRRDDDGFEYYVSFTTEEIDRLHSKFMKNLNQRKAFNLEHTDEGVPAYILECWQIESDGDKAYDYFGFSPKDLPIGSLMLVAQFTNHKAYREIVENDRAAFSVEGMFDLEMVELMDQKILEHNNFKNVDDTMKKQLFTLADGTILMLGADGSYEIYEDATKKKDGYEDMPADKASGDTEEAAYAVTEEDLQDEVPAEAPAEAPAPEGEVAKDAEAAWYTKEEVDAKIDEVLKLIGVLSAKIDEVAGGAEDKPVEDVPVEMSRSQKMANAIGALTMLRAQIS